MMRALNFKSLKMLAYSIIILFSCSKECLNNHNLVHSIIEAEKLLKIQLTFDVGSAYDTGIETIMFTNTCNDILYVSSIEGECVRENCSFSLIDRAGKDLYATERLGEYRPVVRPKKCNKNKRIMILPHNNYIVKRTVSLEAGFSSCKTGEKYSFNFEYTGKIYVNRKLLVKKAAIKSNHVDVWLDSTNTIHFN